MTRPEYSGARSQRCGEASTKLGLAVDLNFLRGTDTAARNAELEVCKQDLRVFERAVRDRSPWPGCGPRRRSGRDMSRAVGWADSGEVATPA